jgi:hypothetical protein
MKSFLVEVYAPGASELVDLVAEAQAAAPDGARYIRSIHIPEDEVCFHLFEGPSAGSLPSLNGRVVEAIEHPP